MLSKVVRKEVYIALHGQSKKFRIIKWIFFILLFSSLYYIFGGVILLKTILVLTVISLCIHFFYRQKTKVWTKDWGGFRVIKMPGDLQY